MTEAASDDAPVDEAPPAVPPADPPPPPPPVADGSSDDGDDTPGKPSSTSVVALALLALVAVLATFVDWEPEAESGGGGGAPDYRFPVSAVTARPGHVVETVSLVGDVVSNRWAELAFQRSGRVEQVLVDLGDEVEEGQVLARLDDLVLDRQADVARAAVQASEALAEIARREAKRGNEVGDDILSRSERDKLNINAEVAEHRVRQAVADVARLEALLDQGELRAPFTGVVTQRNMTDGSHAQIGATAFVLADLERRDVLLEVPEALAAELDVGAPVTLGVDSRPDLVVTARLDALVPAADMSTRTFTAVVHVNGLDPERKLLPGMFVRARFVRREVDADHVVPADAVQGPPDGHWIVVADPPETEDAPPTARFVPVVVLARDARQAAVAPHGDGVLPAEPEVVVTGAENVFPGAPLRTVAHEGLPGEGGTP